MPDITPIDYLAFGFYASSWAGYSLFADHSRWRERSIMKVMDDYRERWMLEMLKRDNRIVDSTIISSLQNGAAFFASTTILALGGLIAGLGASEEAIRVLSALPYVEPGSADAFRLKVLLLIVVMAYAFFKFAWTFRLQSYVAILLGAAPNDLEITADSKQLALRAGRISALGARHFNRGLRAYFFALAALAWFIHPLLFIAMTIYVLTVLHRREFRSKSLKVLRNEAVE